MGDVLSDLAWNAARSAQPAHEQPTRSGRRRPATPSRLRPALRAPVRGRRGDREDARQPEVRQAFNSPFWPFVLASTSVGQEGMDFHWWCHAVFHWNTPANPVDFEQREGRVDRYRGHADPQEHRRAPRRLHAGSG